MKYLIAIIRPEKLEEVVAALNEAGISRMTVSDCRGIGSMDQTNEVYRGVQYTVQHRVKIKIEIALNEEFVQPAVETINRVCHTGDPTDGVILVSELLNSTNIGTGKTGSEAI